MSNKNKTKNKFLSGLLAVTSLATLTLTSTGASGAITVRTNTNVGPYVLNSGANLNKNGAVNEPFITGSALNVLEATAGSTDALGTAGQVFNIAYVEVGGNIPGVFTVTNTLVGSALSFGSIFQTASVRANAFNITLAANSTIILNGKAKEDGTRVNDYTGLGTIDFNNAAGKLIVSGAQASSNNTPKMAYIKLPYAAVGNDATVRNSNAGNATFQVGGALDNLNSQNVNTYATVQSNTFANFKNIAIADGSTLEVDGSEASAGNHFTFAPAANQTLSYGAKGEGTLVMKTTATVNTYKIGTAGVASSGTSFGGSADLQGNIVFNSIANPGTLTSDNGNNVIGVSATSRALSFTALGGALNTATIDKNVFAKNLILAGGKINFTSVVANTTNVDVGDKGTTKFTILTGAKDPTNGNDIKNDIKTELSLTTDVNLGTVITDGSVNAMKSTITTSKKLTLSGGETAASATQISSITANAASSQIDISGAWKFADDAPANAGLKTGNFDDIVFNLKDATIDGTITTAAVDRTVSNFSGTNKVTGDVGTSVNKLNVVTIADGTTTFGGNVNTNTFKFIGTDKVASSQIAAGKNISSAVTTDTDGLGSLSFLGDSTVTGNIGTDIKTLNSVATAGTLNVVTGIYTKDLTLGGKTTGTNASTVRFTGAAGTINTTNLTLKGDAILPANATTNINGGIVNLASSVLTISGAAECTKGTKISTSLTGTGAGTLGNIVINNAGTLKLTDTTTPVTLTVEDTIALGNGTYKFITATDKAVNDGTLINFPVSSKVNSSSAYSKWTILKSKTGYDLIRTNNSDQAIRDDVKAYNGSDTLLTNALAIAGATSGDAQATAADIGNIQDPYVRANAFARVSADSSAQTNAAISTVGAGAQDFIINRNSQLSLDIIRGDVVPYGTVEKNSVAAAGDDDRVTGAQMGVWVQPYYIQSQQKTQQDVSGYNAKSTGGIVGVDANANDNLIVGGAISFVTTKMNFKGFKQGDKTKINTFLVSLYGSQELLNDWSVAGVATFGSSSTNAKSQRIASTNTHGSKVEIAQGKYDSIYMGGQFLLSYNAKLPSALLLTPQFGLRYSSSSSNAYNETGTTNQNRIVSSSKAATNLQAIVGLQIQSTYQSSDMLVTPEAHAFLYQTLSSTTGKVNTQLSGMSSSFIIPSKKQKSYCNLGIGINIKDKKTMEYGFAYNAILGGKGYSANACSLKLRVNF